MDAPGIFTLLAAGYAIVLLAVGWGFDRMAERTSQRSTNLQTGNFTYLESHDAWKCPEDQLLWPTSYDPDNRVMRYRAQPSVCNACPVKETCTVTPHGREVTRQLDPWPHSDSGRFHRGIALAVVIMGLILPLTSLITGHNLTEVLVTIGVIVVVFGAGIIPLARHLWNTPSNAPVTHLPERTDREAVVEAAIDRYSRTFGSDRRISKE